jgi:hypothetical protein
MPPLPAGAERVRGRKSEKLAMFSIARKCRASPLSRIGLSAPLCEKNQPLKTANGSKIPLPGHVAVLTSRGGVNVPR